GSIHQQNLPGGRCRKIVTLVNLLRDHEHAVICDLRRFYGVRLTDMYMGRENPYEVALYVYDCQYIEGSALHRALLGDDSDWNTTNQLLAMVADHLAVLTGSKPRTGRRARIGLNRF